MLYGSQSCFLWKDDEGVTHEVVQGEGGEQGCPLMPTLFALAQHRGLVAAARSLQPGERVLSFLDDLYVVTTRRRACEAVQEVAGQVERHAGVKTHLGKLRAWCRGGGAPPEDLAATAQGAWVADKSPAENGLVVLGTPLGTREFVEAHGSERVEKEAVLLERLADLTDLQYTWVLLSQSAVPRANHTIRIVPPSLSKPYATQHDDAVWQAFCRTFAVTDFAEDAGARSVASLPGRLGGLGLRSATRMAPGAYWSSWANALSVLGARVPDLADKIQRELAQDGGATATCLREAQMSLAELLRAGAQDMPTWAQAREGAKPPPPEDGLDAADLNRGWQCHACSFSEKLYRE